MICSEPHKVEDYQYRVIGCSKDRGKICPYVTVKCANCKGNHMANSSRYSSRHKAGVKAKKEKQIEKQSEKKKEKEEKCQQKSLAFGLALYKAGFRQRD